MEETHNRPIVCDSVDVGVTGLVGSISVNRQCDGGIGGLQGDGSLLRCCWVCCMAQLHSAGLPTFFLVCLLISLSGG
jgi:hypothetical protein